MQAVVDMCRQNVTCEKKGGALFFAADPRFARACGVKKRFVVLY
jgi:hypothetical protein